MIESLFCIITGLNQNDWGYAAYYFDYFKLGNAILWVL